jgi:uncharacterized protein
MIEALHRIICDWGNGYRLELESAVGESGPSVELQAHPFLTQAEREASPDPFTSVGVPAIALRPEADALFEPLQLREETEYLVDVTVPLPRDLAIDRRSTAAAWPLSPSLQGVFRSDPPKRWRDVRGGVVITGSINFGSRVGIANLAPEGRPPVRFEIVPRKLGYFDDFKALLEEVAQELTALLIEVDSASTIALRGDDQASADPAARLFHYRALMDSRSLPVAIEAIVARPHIRVMRDITFDRVDAATDTDTELYASHLRTDDLVEGGPLSRMFHGYSPTSLPRRKSNVSFDTPENQYTKAVLEQFSDDIGRLYSQLSQAGKPRSAVESLKWAVMIDNWLAHPMWREVRTLRVFPSNSQVLQRREGYREILAADMRLQLGMTLPWSRGIELSGGFDGDLRPIEELYEYWCYFTLRSILRDVCGAHGVQKGSLIRRTARGFDVRLRKGHKTRTDFTYSSGGSRIQVALFYNRSFVRRESRRHNWVGSYSATFRPDYSILIRQEHATEAPLAHWIHFDAKYRIDTVDVGGALSESATDSVHAAVYQRATLDEMHSYRDGVLGSRGAYVLYPGSKVGERVFIRYPGAHYPDDAPYYPGVGAFPLRPGANSEQRAALTKFIRSLFDDIASRRTYQEEIGVRER